MKIEDLTAKVNEFLAPFGCEAEFSDEFEYLVDTTIIHYTIFIPNSSIRAFSSFVKEEFNCITDNPFILPLLHEVGHFYTLNSFSDDEIEDYSLQVEKIEEEIKQNKVSSIDGDKYRFMYYHLEIEKVATTWAVDYYKNNKKRCDDFYNVFAKMCKDFVDEINNP